MQIFIDIDLDRDIDILHCDFISPLQYMQKFHCSRETPQLPEHKKPCPTSARVHEVHEGLFRAHCRKKREKRIHVVWKLDVVYLRQRWQPET